MNVGVLDQRCNIQSPSLDIAASRNSLTERWSFEIMLDRKAFLFIPSYLEVGGLKVPVTVQLAGSTEMMDIYPLLDCIFRFRLACGRHASFRDQ